MVRAFLTFTDRTARIAETVAMVLLYGFCALMLAEVFSRGFLKTSLAFSWEYSAFAMCGVFLLGFGPALRHGTHVRVGFLLTRPALGRFVDIAATAAGLIFAVLMFEAFFTVFLTSLEKGLRQSSYMATPLAIPQAIAVLGAGEFVLALAARLLRLVTGAAPDLERKAENADG